MGELCGWSEDRLAVRHARYAKIFRRQTDQDLDRRGSDISNHDCDASPPPQQMSTPGRSRWQSTPPPPLPAPPQPSADKDLHVVAAEEVSKTEPQAASANSEYGDIDVWGMKPVEAVNFLCAYVEILVKEANLRTVKPPSPPTSSSSSGTPSRSGTPVQPSLSPGRLHREPDDQANTRAQGGATVSVIPSKTHETVVSPESSSPENPHLMRVPRASRTPIDSPVSNPRTPIHSMPPSPRLPHIVVTESDKKYQSHHLAKRFFCKSVPNVSLAAYLGRIHKYCQMSTAVYLAAGMYIEKLSLLGGMHWTSLPLSPSPGGAKESEEDEQVVDLTPRSVHRLLLAALRVANKALSDLYWPHKRVAEVGGVSQLELQRLEVSMCYLCDFRLQVSLRDLEAWVRRARRLGVMTEGVS